MVKLDKETIILLFDSQYIFIIWYINLNQNIFFPLLTFYRLGFGEWKQICRNNLVKIIVCFRYFKF